MNATAAKMPTPAEELERIVKLPAREPLDCERERGSGGIRFRRWAPSAQAVIEVETAKYTRGKRLSCGCRTRHVTAMPGGRLMIFQEPVMNQPPPLPIVVSVDDFCRDSAHDKDVCDTVGNLKSGVKIVLPGLANSPACLVELNPAQAWILREAPRTQGIFGMISVGGGKTVASLLVPLTMPERKQWALFIKPDQRLHYRNAYLRLREHFRVPSIVFDHANHPEWSVRYVGQPIVRVIPYSTLSNPKSTQLLETLELEGIIADEWHLLANKQSSRTMRFLRLMAKRNDIVLCGWSGSTLDDSYEDCSHLAAHSLGLGSPYPIPPSVVQMWSAVMDPSPNPDRQSSVAKALLRAFGRRGVKSDLYEAGLARDAGIREGHKERVIRTPGVITTASSSVNCSLTISKREPTRMPETVREALTNVRNLAVRPDGEELVEAHEIKTCARHVGAGYYYYWSYPNGEPPSLIEQWFAARKAWNKELRKKLLNGEPHLDSKKLCEDAAKRGWQVPRYQGDLPVWQPESWPTWAAIEDHVRPNEGNVKWIDDYLARDAAQWATEHVGIVWVHSGAFGRRIAELAGINYHGGGPHAEARILAEDGKKSIVASIKAHSESRDGLQYKFHKQLVAEMVASGKGWEQLLGRLVREGQSAETVETFVYLHFSENRDAFRKALMFAEFVEASTPNRQLLLAADIDFEVAA